MPPLTQSPISSPSLRTIAHAQMRSSYFPPVPTAPHSYHGRIPPTPNSSLNIIHNSPQPNIGSTLVGCLKHTQNISGRPLPSSSSQSSTNISEIGPYHRGDSEFFQVKPNLKPIMKSINPIEKRRISTPSNMIKVSQIPIGNSPNLRSIHTSSSSFNDNNKISDSAQRGIDVQGKRRPSFKIELPPRQPTIQQTHQKVSSMQPIANVIQNSSSGYVSSTPIFKDPFENHNATYDYPAGGYMILRAPTKGNNSFMEDFPSPTQQQTRNGLMDIEYMYDNEGIGLGYSLNKRVATPWLRSKGDEEEWLKSDDLEDIDRKIGNMNVA
ncbi:uncharacterized protein I206_104356 [Kwoniella pini CBS 10737]|uniref:Uncharacterized protein n=1 Tax=Kwoniella pini CBS 10737 TaxID=1296096 RepID=A0A1B9I1Z3_9TREE|nr:uncharacterized protein I206_04066 [Kwoniella pini CBS 10737]OCF49544.1 hypothetical protein I206_04066 [Kwoniella pini CBS 10737]